MNTEELIQHTADTYQLPVGALEEFVSNILPACTRLENAGIEHLREALADLLNDIILNSAEPNERVE
jgi:hypothetical protein